MFLSVPLARMLVSFFSLVGLTDMSSLAAVLADDHAFVDFVAGGDEQLGPLLQRVEAVGDDAAGDHRDQHAVGPLGDVAFQRAVVLEAMVNDGGALRGVEEPRAQADQAAGGDRELDVRVVVVGGHLRRAGRGGRRRAPSRGRACRAALRRRGSRTALR